MNQDLPTLIDLLECALAAADEIDEALLGAQIASVLDEARKRAAGQSPIRHAG